MSDSNPYDMVDIDSKVTGVPLKFKTPSDVLKREKAAAVLEKVLPTVLGTLYSTSEQWLLCSTFCCIAFIYLLELVKTFSYQNRTGFFCIQIQILTVPQFSYSTCGSIQILLHWTLYTEFYEDMWKKYN